MVLSIQQAYKALESGYIVVQQNELELRISRLPGQEKELTSKEIQDYTFTRIPFDSNLQFMRSVNNSVRVVWSQTKKINKPDF